MKIKFVEYVRPDDDATAARLWDEAEERFRELLGLQSRLTALLGADYWADLADRSNFHNHFVDLLPRDLRIELEIRLCEDGNYDPGLLPRLAWRADHAVQTVLSAPHWGLRRLTVALFERGLKAAERDSRLVGKRVERECVIADFREEAKYDTVVVPGYPDKDDR